MSRRISITEAAESFDVSLELLKTWIRRGKLSTEKRMVVGGSNATPKNFVDPLEVARLTGKAAVGQKILEGNENALISPAVGQSDPPLTHRPASASETASEPILSLEGQLDPPPESDPPLTHHRPNPVPDAKPSDPPLIVTTGTTAVTTLMTDITALSKSALESAQARLAWIAPLAMTISGAATRGEITRALEAAAQTHGISERQVRRLVDRYRAGGVVNLARKPRQDAGQRRIPRDLVELCISLWVTNPAASAKRVRRIIELNDPRVLEYRPSPRSAAVKRLSESGIGSIRAAMEREPALRYALMDATARREFQRVWIGEVMASRALELVEADMTRCDVFVYDPETDTVYRLRVHAMIDVFTGCIPSFVFTRAEDQLATNRMLMLGLLEKPAPWTAQWPIWGRPDKLYWDNGKTYRSERSHAALEALGVTIIHSRPRVSHSRGKIERFFGTLHRFESTLPGYGGPNTKERDHYNIAELWAKTRDWIARGASPTDDPYPNRLLLEDEYKRKCLAWLTGDYHQEIVTGGKTRQQIFLETAPKSSRVRYDFGDLQTVFAKRETRRVKGNGTVQYQSRQYAMPDAGLVVWQGQEVVLLINDTFPEVVIEAAIQERGGLRLLGRMEPMNIAANSVRANQYRHDAKERIAELKKLSAEIQRQYLQPELRADVALERALPTSSDAAPDQSYTVSRLERDPDAAARKAIEDAVTAALEDGLILDAPVDDFLGDNL